MALAEVRQRPVHMAHRIVVAQMEQMKVNFRTVELRSVVVQSLKNIQTARKELLPLTTNLSTADAMAFQIKLREISLNEILVIRVRLRTRFRSIDVVADKRRFRSTQRMPSAHSRESIRADNKQLRGYTCGLRSARSRSGVAKTRRLWKFR